MKRTHILATILLGACLMIISACSGGESKKANDDNGESILTIAQDADIATFDIHDYDDIKTFSIHNNIFSPLFNRDENNELQPLLVESYENTDDTTWKFELKDGVTFHNGDQLTAEDVKFTLERLATDTSLKLHRNNTVKEVKVIDDLNFEVITHSPDPILLNRFATLGGGILPKNYIEENGMDEFLKNPIGSGPYKFVEWVKDDKVTLEKFDDYFEGDIVDWDKVVFRSVPETSTRVSELLTGGVDVIDSVPFNEWERLDENDGTAVVYSKTNATYTLEVNRLPGTPLTDKRVIQAIDLAIDNQVLIDSIFGGQATPVRTRVLEGFTGAHPDFYDTYLHDPKKAKELLAEAGYADGFELEIATASNYKDVVEMLGGMLEEIGITPKITVMEWGNWLSMIGAGKNPELTLVPQTSAMFDGASYSKDFGSEVFPERFHYKNEELDQLLEAANKNMNPEEREKQTQRMQEILAEDLPIICLAQPDRATGLSDRVDYTPPISPMYYVPDMKKNEQ